MNELGKRLQKIRNEKGFPQKEVASALKMHRSSYSRVENDLQKLTPEQIKLFCEFCDISANYLLELNTPKDSPFSKEEMDEIIKNHNNIMAIINKKIPKD